MHMKYDTNNIDEAAYLALQGYHFTVRRTGAISALFSFETDKHFNESALGFGRARRPCSFTAGSPRELL